MSLQIRPSDQPGLVQARITQRMTLQDQRALETLARSSLDDGDDARLLVVLDAFEGWTKGEGWNEDLAFMATYGERIRRIAVVGEPRWRDEVLAFVGQGFRSTEVRYFEPAAQDEANTWVRG